VVAAAHPDAARDWLAFIQTAEALAVMQGYGFKAVEARP